MSHGKAKARLVYDVHPCVAMVQKWLKNAYDLDAYNLLGYFDPRACSRVKIIIAEGFLQTQKRRFAGAMAGGDLFEFPFVLQVVHQPVNLGFRGAHEMKTASEKMHARINGTGGLQNLLDSWVRTADDDGQAIRASKNE